MVKINCEAAQQHVNYIVNAQASIVAKDSYMEVAEQPAAGRGLAARTIKWGTVPNVNEEMNTYIGLVPRVGALNKHAEKADCIQGTALLWWDIDHVDNPKAALPGILAKLPESVKISLVVASGRGLHLYCRLDEAIQAATAESVMACIAEMIGADHTQDISRIFRLAGSIHCKDPENIKEVRIIHGPTDEVASYADLVRLVPADSADPEDAAVDAVDVGALQAAIATAPEQAVLDDWLSGLSQRLQQIIREGTDPTKPDSTDRSALVHTAVTGMVGAGISDEQIAQIMTCADYSISERVLQEQATSRGAEGYLATSLDKAREYLAKQESEGMLVRDIFPNAPGPADLRIPAGYELTERSTVKIVYKNKTTQRIPIAWHPIIVTATTEDMGENEPAMRILYYLKVGEWRKVNIEHKQTDGRQFIASIQKTTLIMSPDQAKETMIYLSAFEACNEELLLPSKSVADAGWTKIDKHDEFVPYSERIRLQPRSSGDKAMANPEVWELRGNLDGWREIFNMVRHYPVALFTLVAALTPPLLGLLDGDGNDQSHTVLLGVDPGTGKSVMQKVAASIYGDPKELFKSWDSTAVGYEQALALRKNLPALYEDLQNATTDQLHKMVYGVFNERGRERGAKEGGTRLTAEYKTVVIGSAETDLRNRAKREGFLRRILVVTGAPFGDKDGDEIPNLAARLLRLSRNNRSALGRAWIEYLKQIRADQEKMKELQESYYATLWLVQGLSSDKAVGNQDAVTLRRLAAMHALAGMMVGTLLGLDWTDEYGEESPGDAALWALRNSLDGLGEVEVNTKYMRQALEWVARVEDSFSDVVPAGRERYGIKTDDYVGFYRDALERYLRDLNKDNELDISAALAAWAKRGWINTRKGGGYTIVISVNNEKRRMIKVNLHAKGVPLAEEAKPATTYETTPDGKVVVMHHRTPNIS